VPNDAHCTAIIGGARRFASCDLQAGSGDPHGLGRVPNVQQHGSPSRKPFYHYHIGEFAKRSVRKLHHDGPVSDKLPAPAFQTWRQ
jgi:hypothetical protein